MNPHPPSIKQLPLFRVVVLIIAISVFMQRKMDPQQVRLANERDLFGYFFLYQISQSLSTVFPKRERPPGGTIYFRPNRFSNSSLVKVIQVGRP